MRDHIVAEICLPPSGRVSLYTGVSNNTNCAAARRYRSRVYTIGRVNGRFNDGPLRLEEYSDHYESPIMRFPATSGAPYLVTGNDGPPSVAIGKYVSPPPSPDVSLPPSSDESQPPSSDESAPPSYDESPSSDESQPPSSDETPSSYESSPSSPDVSTPASPSTRSSVTSQPLTPDAVTRPYANSNTSATLPDNTSTVERIASPNSPPPINPVAPFRKYKFLYTPRPYGVRSSPVTPNSVERPPATSDVTRTYTTSENNAPQSPALNVYNYPPPPHIPSSHYMCNYPPPPLPYNVLERPLTDINNRPYASSNIENYAPPSDLPNVYNYPPPPMPYNTMQYQLANSNIGTYPNRTSTIENNAPTYAPHNIYNYPPPPIHYNQQVATSNVPHPYVTSNVQNNARPIESPNVRNRYPLDGPPPVIYDAETRNTDRRTATSDSAARDLHASNSAARDLHAMISNSAARDLHAAISNSAARDLHAATSNSAARDLHAEMFTPASASDVLPNVNDTFPFRHYQTTAPIARPTAAPAFDTSLEHRLQGNKHINTVAMHDENYAYYEAAKAMTLHSKDDTPATARTSSRSSTTPPSSASTRPSTSNGARTTPVITEASREKRRIQSAKNRIITDEMRANRQNAAWRANPDNCEYQDQGFYLDKTCKHPNPYMQLFELDDTARIEFLKNAPCPKGQHPCNPFRFGLVYAREWYCIYHIVCSI